MKMFGENRYKAETAQENESIACFKPSDYLNESINYLNDIMRAISQVDTISGPFTHASYVRSITDGIQLTINGLKEVCVKLRENETATPAPKPLNESKFDTLKETLRSMSQTRSDGYQYPYDEVVRATAKGILDLNERLEKLETSNDMPNAAPEQTKDMNLSFAEALEALRAGKVIKRAGWNDCRVRKDGPLLYFELPETTHTPQKWLPNETELFADDWQICS